MIYDVYFQFFNSYISFFYIAFIESNVSNDCGNGSCMQALAQNLGIIFGFKLIIGNAIVFLYPYLSYVFSLKRRGMNVHEVEALSPPEREFLHVPVRGRR